MKLTVLEGDGDAKRTGYWTVVGPQPESDKYALIYRHVGEVYSWELLERTSPERNSTSTFMLPVASSKDSYVDSLEAALEAVRAAWPGGRLEEPTPEPIEEPSQRSDMWPYLEL